MTRDSQANDLRVALFAAAATAIAMLPLLLTGPVEASDPPHWAGALSTVDCTSNCHITHHAQGGNLTADASNVALCQSCHSSGALPITNAAVSAPGSKGTSHGFGVCATNPTYSTLAPQNVEMNLRLMGADGPCPDGYVVCSTCHDQHTAEPAEGGTSRVGEAQLVQAAGSFGSVTSGGSYDGAAGVWYLVDITANGNENAARFRYSKDNGTSWFPSGCTPSTLGPCLTANSATAVTLDSGVTALFVDGGGGQDFQLGGQWEFFASYPFLRAKLDAGDINSVDKFCRDCHRSWVMTHDADLVGGGGVRGYDGNFKSHPVGVGLGVNGQGYDRTDPLDGSGLAQNNAAPIDVDGNASNDLWLDDTGNVQCLTCHRVHYADSNTQTVDSP